MPRKTRYIVYVDKDIMGKPTELFDAAFAHLIKKNVGIAKRKQFMAQFIRSRTVEQGLAVINEWVQVRDVANFPYRQEVEALASTGITAAEAIKALTPGDEAEDSAEAVDGDEEGSE